MAVRKLSSLLIKSAVLLLVFVLTPLTSPQATKVLPEQSTLGVEKELGIEIFTPKDAQKGESDKLFPTGFGSAVGIPLAHLTIFDNELAKNYEFVTVEPSYFKDFVRVRIILDHDIHCGKPCENVIGTYTLREGGKIYPPELKQFGIEPFEIKAITNTIQPSIAPKTQVINKTQAIKVIKVEEVPVHGDEKGYSLLVKNISVKDIASIYFAYGKNPLGIGALGDSSGNPILRAGTFYCYRPMRLGLGYRGEFLPSEITINSVIFTDGTADGDTKTATYSLNHARVMKILAPTILNLIDKTLDFPDKELPSAVEKLIQQIRTSFPSSLNSEEMERKLKTEYPDLVPSLKKQYPNLTETELRDLTWDVISGRAALSPLDDLFFGMKTHKDRLEGKWGDKKPKISLEQYLRAKLIDIKEQYERAVNSKW